MSTPVEPWQPILDSFKQLHSAWPLPDWSWDHRFKCVTSSFAAAAIPGVRTMLDPVFGAEWTPETLANGPEDVRALAERCGGLRPGQLLLTGTVVAGLMPFALWWPWGDGAMLSVRLGIANSDRPKDLYPVLRSTFGIK